MISENITKQEFIVQVLERDLNNIYKAQRLIAQKNIYVECRALEVVHRKGKKIGVRSGALLASLENPDFLIRISGEKFIVSAAIVKQIRFIDMKKFGNRKIYNRQVWGILYNNALKDLRFNYGKALRDYVGAKLNEAFNQRIM
ncbi:MAG: hypothetical protein LBG15_04870 [Dysgonamonadaceae bacterium]|jgi:hypothetical protein|nr:hypothetical protein [Dysgonamonadaceae bacterium]